MDVYTKIHNAEVIQNRLMLLTQSLKGWSVLASLYRNGGSHAEDVAHALAVEAIALVQQVIFLTHRLGEACLKGNWKRVENLLVKLNKMDTRVKMLGEKCREAMDMVENKKQEGGAA